MLRQARLPLLSELALDGAGYVPDFLSPHPSGPSPTVEEELERVRCTPPERVLGELEALRDGRPRNGLAGSELPAGVQRAMARGGAQVARQAADEIRRYWELAFAPHWEVAKAALDAEVDRRAGVQARHGAARLFNSLHLGIRWADGTLRVANRFRIALPVPLMVVVPSLVVPRPGVAVDPTRDGDRPRCSSIPCATRPSPRPLPQQFPPSRWPNCSAPQAPGCSPRWHNRPPLRS
ncbi:hypothetical protein ACFCX0_29200 [Streptomyces sp. NPDC056352]|uniref:hypothetical protein n=1 Tax=Streptomyces sp. NPDC056352 TaxID=3345791 RepID=UPI0035E32D70